MGVYPGGRCMLCFCHEFDEASVQQRKFPHSSADGVERRICVGKHVRQLAAGRAGEWPLHVRCGVAHSEVLHKEDPLKGPPVNLKPEWMPGPTDEARALQHAQTVVLDEQYAVWRALAAQFPAAAHAAINAHPEHQAAVARYEATVAQLEALLGPDVHCNWVDCELWSCFSDWYKSEEGFRPRLHMTRAQVKVALAELAQRPPRPELQLD